MNNIVLPKCLIQTESIDVCIKGLILGMWELWSPRSNVVLQVVVVVVVVGCLVGGRAPTVAAVAVTSWGVSRSPGSGELVLDILNAGGSGV